MSEQRIGSFARGRSSNLRRQLEQQVRVGCDSLAGAQGIVGYRNQAEDPRHQEDDGVPGYQKQSGKNEFRDGDNSHHGGGREIGNRGCYRGLSQGEHPNTSSMARLSLNTVKESVLVDNRVDTCDGSQEGSNSAAELGSCTLPTDMMLTRGKHLNSKQETSGRRVVLKANYFKLLSRTEWGLKQYSVSFNPDVEATVIRKSLVRDKKDFLGAYIFDGQTLYSSFKYPQDPVEFKAKCKSDNADILVTIKFTNEICKSNYQNIQFFNTLMRKCYENMHLQMVGRNYFDIRSKIRVETFGLELWPGYSTSIRQHENNILMCAEIAHKVMRTETVLDLLHKCYTQNRNNYVSQFGQQVRGNVVMTFYNNNTYRIDDIDFNVTPGSTFKKDNSEITYKEYYKQKYNIDIREINQPLLVTRTKPRERRAKKDEFIYLVPELCQLTGITDEMRKNHSLMNALAVHTRINPSGRIQKLLKLNNRLQSEPKIVEEFKCWNLQLENKLCDVPARILNPEEVIFGKKKIVRGADWTTFLKDIPMYQQIKLIDWFIIFPRGKNCEISTFIGNIAKVCSGFKMEFQPPKQCEVSDQAGSYTNKIEEIMSRHTPQLICCVVMNNRSDRYTAIKKKCAVDRPVCSQVVLIKTITKPGMSVATKIVVQINTKLGGVPWAVQIPAKGLMVIGYDVCHDKTKGSTDFGAMVASLDKNCSRYFSTVSGHPSGEELSNYFSANLRKAISCWQEHNSQEKPTRIIVFRDGVGEGDYPAVMSHEVGAIQKTLQEIYGDQNKGRFAFIVVSKRINTRLFFEETNPPPGTIVDDVITNPLWYDFFLISQSVTLGTVSPTYYSVLHNNTGLSPDQLQRLSFKLTHLYYNWSGTIRVPAPCQYAHKLSFVVTQSIHRCPSPALETLLHFL